MSGVPECGYLLNDPSVEGEEEKASLGIITFPFVGLTQTSVDVAEAC